MATSGVGLLDFVTFTEALVWLRDNNFISFRNGCFFLTTATFDINERKIRSLQARKKLLELRTLLDFCKNLSWVRGVAVTGSVGVGQADADDDVDLLVVTSKNRLWITRVVLIVFAEILGKHRSRTGSSENEWCFNLWLESDKLSVHPASRSIYTAYEVIQAKWLLDKDSIQNWFYFSNMWVRKILPNSQINVSNKSLRHQPFSQNIFFDFLDLLSYLFQRIYMNSHITRERVSLSAAFFHPRDTKGIIFQRWKTSLSPKATVLVTGVFDVLHHEHLHFLRASRSLGGKLVVGIESDKRVRRIKGKDRPINKSSERRKRLEELDFIDSVIVLPEKFSQPIDHLHLLQSIKPSILAVSSHTPHLDEKRRLMAKIGGVVRVVLEQNPAISTTKLIARKEMNVKKRN